MTRRELKEIDAPALKQWLDTGQAVVIDVREPSEYARERIAGTRLAPLSSFAPGEFAGEGGKTGVFICRTGNRTAVASRQLLDTGFDEVYHLSGGIEAWKRADLPVQANPTAPMDLIRQVMLTAGALVLLGVVLSVFVSPWFLGLSAFVGAGLCFSGISGFCAMAEMLSLMPWNRPPRPAAAEAA